MNLGEKNSYTLNLINLLKNFCKFLRLGQQKKIQDFCSCKFTRKKNSWIKPLKLCLFITFSLKILSLGPQKSNNRLSKNVLKIINEIRTAKNYNKRLVVSLWEKLSMIRATTKKSNITRLDVN